MKTRVVVKGDQELIRKLQFMSREARSESLDVATQAGAEVIRGLASRNVRRKSGTLGRSLHTKRASGQSAIYQRTYIVGTDVVYARIQELGGTIVPKRGPFLVFEIDGQLIFAKKVTIPARPYLRPAFDTGTPAAVAVVGATFRRLVIQPAVVM